MKKRFQTESKWILSAILATALSLQMTGCATLLPTAKHIAAVSESAISSAVSSAASSSKAVSRAAASILSSSSAASSKAASSAAPTAVVPQPQTKHSSGAEVQAPKKIESTQSTKQIKRLSVAKSGAVSDGYTALKPNSGYRALTTDTERTLYGLIGGSVYQIGVQATEDGYSPTGQISIPAKLTEAQLRVTITAYQDDNPQVFWLANAYSYGYEGNNTILQLYSTLTQSQCNSAILYFNGKIQSIIKSIPSGLSEFDREEYLFNIITQNCSYDTAAVSDSSRWQAFTAYGALVGGSAVCEGYSRAMLMLASDAGLQTLLIRGTGDGVAHMWNAVYIGGSWYHLDLTWCDSTKLIYNFFNLDDQQIKLTHVISPLVSTLTDSQICSSDSLYNLTLPTCSSTQENYFRVKGIPVTTLNSSGDSTVINALVPLMKAKKETFAFRIVPSDYNATIKGLVSASPYKMADYLEKAAALAGVNLNEQGVAYATDQEDAGLDVFVSYQ